MNKFVLRAVCAAAGLAALGTPLSALAESNIVTGTGTLTATARLDFRVVIPKMLFLRVGATGTGVDLVDFSVPGLSVGNGTPVAATGGGVTAQVRANGTGVTLSAVTTGALTSGTDTLSFSNFAISTAVLTSPTALAAPALLDSGTSTVAVAPTGTITNQDATWTFAYANTALVPPGTYGGTPTNGRVTYTATMP